MEPRPRSPAQKYDLVIFLRGRFTLISMNEQLEHKRHTLAHLLAKAVIDAYPHAKLTLGPAFDNGFYYDIDFSGGGFANP